MKEDDFHYMVEPVCVLEERWAVKVRKWLRRGKWSGINLMLLGLIALAVGHLTPPRPTVVNQMGRMPMVRVVDNWAIDFNQRLISCQRAGTSTYLLCISYVSLLTYRWHFNRFIVRMSK